MNLNHKTLEFCCTVVCAMCASPLTFWPAIWNERENAYWHAPKFHGIRARYCRATAIREARDMHKNKVPA